MLLLNNMLANAFPFHLPILHEGRGEEFGLAQYRRGKSMFGGLEQFRSPYRSLKAPERHPRMTLTDSN